MIMLPESLVIVAGVAAVVGLLPEACVLVRVGRSGRPRLKIKVFFLENFGNILETFWNIIGNILEIFPT